MTDEEIVSDVVWEIARRKGMVQDKTDPDTGATERVIHADRNWMLEAFRVLTPLVAAAR